MKQRETPKRNRERPSNNRTTTGFRISDELWAGLQPLLPVPLDTHHLSGGRPRVPDRMCADSIFYVLRTGCHWQVLAQTELCAPSTAHESMPKNGCGQGFFSSCGKQDRSNLKSFKGSIGTGTRVKEPERSSRGGGETPAKAQPVVERVGENAVGSRPGMRCQPRWRLKKPGAMGCARVQSTPDAIVMELTFPIHALATALHESRLKRGLR